MRLLGGCLKSFLFSRFLFFLKETFTCYLFLCLLGSMEWCAKVYMWISGESMRVPGIKIRSLGLAASIFCLLSYFINLSSLGLKTKFLILFFSFFQHFFIINILKEHCKNDHVFTKCLVAYHLIVFKIPWEF